MFLNLTRLLFLPSCVWGKYLTVTNTTKFNSDVYGLRNISASFSSTSCWSKHKTKTQLHGCSTWVLDTSFMKGQLSSCLTSSTVSCSQADSSCTPWFLPEERRLEDDEEAPGECDEGRTGRMGLDSLRGAAVSTRSRGRDRCVLRSEQQMHQFCWLRIRMVPLWSMLLYCTETCLDHSVHLSELFDVNWLVTDWCTHCWVDVYMLVVKVHPQQVFTCLLTGCLPVKDLLRDSLWAGAVLVLRLLMWLFGSTFSWLTWAPVRLLERVGIFPSEAGGVMGFFPEDLWLDRVSKVGLETQQTHLD